MRSAQPVLPADPTHEEWMALALEQARAAIAHEDVPIGAVLVQLGGTPQNPGPPQVIAARHNEREVNADPIAHAEMLVIQDAAAALGRWRLDDCIVVVTLEPCPMCAGALWASRISGVVFGAEDPKAGALGSLYHLGQDPRLNHEFPVRGRVLEAPCAELLVSFFATRR